MGYSNVLGSYFRQEKQRHLGSWEGLRFNCWGLVALTVFS